jgi:CrcB protein
VNLLAVPIGGAIGSALRYGVSGLWLVPVSLAFPWGTFVVNVTGSLALGFLARYIGPQGSHALFLFFTVGLCGGYTTFSTFALDIVTLLERGDSLRAVLYAVASVLASSVAVIAGYAAARGPRPIPCGRWRSGWQTSTDRRWSRSSRSTSPGAIAPGPGGSRPSPTRNRIPRR